MEDERDAEDAIRALDQIECGRKGRRLQDEWTKVLFLLILIINTVFLLKCYLFCFPIVMTYVLSSFLI